MKADLKSITQKEPKRSSDPPYVYGIISAIVVFAVVFVSFEKLGVARGESILFALLSAVAIGLTVYRYRLVLGSLRSLECQVEANRLAERSREGHLFSRSMGCVFSMEPKSMTLVQASPGFLKAINYGSKYTLNGRPVAEILKVDLSMIRSFTDRLIETDRVLDLEFTLETLSGDSHSAVLSGLYSEELDRITFSLFIMPADVELLSNLEENMSEVERFQRGIVRREMRILELKGEVNAALVKSGESAKYRIDHETKDHELEAFSTQSMLGGKVNG